MMGKRYTPPELETFMYSTDDCLNATATLPETPEVTETANPEELFGDG